MSAIGLVAAGLLMGQAARGSAMMPPALQITPPPVSTNSQRTAKPEEELVWAITFGDDAEKAAAATRLELHPELVNPFHFVSLVGYLWARGDKAQAAFWYYFWEERSRPWAKQGRSDEDIRTSLRETLGPSINGWAGSDLPAELGLKLRSISYERRMPLYPGHPSGVGDREWLRVVADDRAENGAETVKRNFPIERDSLTRLAAARRHQGLYVGPWTDSGQPIPESWR